MPSNSTRKIYVRAMIIDNNNAVKCLQQKFYERFSFISDDRNYIVIRRSCFRENNVIAERRQ